MAKVDNDLYGRIRRMYSVEKRSQRAIARALGVSRKTVKRYCEGATTPDRAKEREVPKGDERLAIEKAIMDMFAENVAAPKKQNLNGKIVWEMLLKSGYPVGESTVRKYIRELRIERPDVFVPLDFEPGEMMQVDWGDAVACLDGMKTDISLFCSVLPYSFSIHCSVFPNKTNMCWEAGHVNAFHAHGGVARYVMPDNLKSAVLKGTGANAVKQESFKRLEAHYAFEAKMANAEAGWEKGAVENLVSIVRSIAFVPMPRVRDFRELQELVTERCMRYCMTHRIKTRPKGIMAMWEEEKKHLIPLPLEPWEPCRETKVKVHSDLTVRIEGIRYSVPAEYVQMWLSAKVSPFHVDLYKGGSSVWRHKKGMHPTDHQYIPEHYLDILLIKQRAIPNAVPLKKGVMPEEMSDFLRLCKEPDRYMHLVNVLLLGRKTNPDKLFRAVRQANSTGSPTYDKVCLYLGLRSDGTSDDSGNGDIMIRPPDLTSYDKLIERRNDTNGR